MLIYQVQTETDYTPNDPNYAGVSGQTSLPVYHVPTAWGELQSEGKTLGTIPRASDRVSFLGQALAKKVEHPHFIFNNQ